MSLPVSQYEALLAEVRGLRRKAQRVQQLARPLISAASGPHQQQNERLKEPLDYTMESLLLNRSNSPNHDVATASGQDRLTGDGDCFGGMSRGVASHSQISVSSEPVPKLATRGPLDSMYHGAWPNMERTGMWNSEPASLGASAQLRRDHDRVNLPIPQDVSSVMSFASSSGGGPLEGVLCGSDRSKWSSQQLEAKMDVVHSLLSMLGSQEHVDMGETLLALSTCPESCLAMRQSGCIPLLVQLVQSDKDSDTRRRAAQALHNLVNSQPDEKIRKREVRILKLLEHARSYVECLRNGTEFDAEVSASLGPAPEDGDKHPVQTVAHLMKLSFDEGHRQAICQLGGIHTIAAMVEIEHSMHGSSSPEGHCVLMRRYACMALTNLTFGDGGNKALLCSLRDFVRALVAQLQSPSDELRQVTASVLRNLSWRADSTSKEVLKDIGSVQALMQAAMLQNKENTLKSILSALWNLSAHCTENKAEICSVEGALGFLVNMLVYKTPSKSLAIMENAGGILRNISSQIAVRDDYRDVLRRHGCLQILLDQLKSPSLTIVSNACGTLWNLSAKNAQDQDALWQMGAPAMLRSLNHSKHKMIAMGSSAALKNLLSCRPQQTLTPRIDATALSLNLPELPTLGARKQKALLQDLDQSLSETYENIDKDSPVKNKPDKGVDIGEFVRNKSNSRSPEDLTAAFSSLNLNEPSTSYPIDLRHKTRIPQSYGSSSLPYVPLPTRRTNPGTFIPVRSKFSEPNYEDDVPEQPIDYSRKYFDSKSGLSGTKAPPDEVNQKEGDGFGMGYTETDLDQPTDYSLRYAEDDSDSDICGKIAKQEYVQDTVKTYCTEGTPYETPYVFSNATSMSDLRNVGTGEEKPDLIDNDIHKNKDTKTKEVKNVDEKDHCSTEDISQLDNADLKPPKSEFSSGSMSPEKPVNCCEEGTPGYFSRGSGFGSGLDSMPVNEPTVKKEPLEEPELVPSTQKTRKPDKPPKTPNETKAVKFEQVVNYAEETPLMFSRSSSLASLDSIEQHSIHDDRSSVVSDFSRLTSGIVSPSELPDSPTQTVPPSPRPTKSKLEFPSTSKLPRNPPDNKPRVQHKPSVFEDNVTKFKEESTPVQFSTATSLSSLAIDEQDDSTNIDSPAKTPDTKVLIPNQDEDRNKQQEQQEKRDSEKETDKELSGSDDLNDDDEEILAACINDGMQSNISAPTASSTPTKLPMSNYSFQHAKPATGIPMMRRTPPRNIPVGTTHIVDDAPKTYCTEDTPAHLSRTGSNSNLSVLSIVHDDKSKHGELSDDSSNLSGDNENLLAECIQSAMPKPKKDLKCAVTCLPQPRRLSSPFKQQQQQQLQPRKAGEVGKVPPRPQGLAYPGGNKERERRESSLPPCLSARDEVENYAVEGGPCHFSLRSSLSDLTVDGGSVAGLKQSQQRGASGGHDKATVLGAKSTTITDHTKNGSNKSITPFLEASFDNDFTFSNSDNCNLDNVFAKSCEESGHFVDNRMLDPDAMIESLDRFTAELVSQASHLNKDKDRDGSSHRSKVTDNTHSDNTWNDDTSPNEVTFPSISGSAPNVITFGSDKDVNQLDEDVVDAVENNIDEFHSNDFSSINTSTMTESTLIAIEATKMATAFKMEAEMSQSITSAASLDLDSILPPSQLNSMTNSAVGLEKAVPKSPKLSSRKKSLPGSLLMKRALSNSSHQAHSLESLESYGLTNSEKQNAHSETFMDIDNVRAEFDLSARDVQEYSPHPIFNVKREFIASGPISFNADLELTNPPSIFNEITDLCNSLADVQTETIGSETSMFEDCFTHVEATLVDHTLQDDPTEFSDANSVTPIQTDQSSAENTPKKSSKPLKSMMTKQRRNLARERYKTYTVAAEMVMQESIELESKSKEQESDEVSLDVTYVSPTYTVESPKTTPQERRKTEQESKSSSASPSPTRSKLSIRRNFMQKRLENKERFRTQTLNESSFSSPEIASASPPCDANDLHLLVQKEADLVLRTLRDSKFPQDEMLDNETLSLVSNDEDSEHNSGGSINYRTYHKSWGTKQNLPVIAVEKTVQGQQCPVDTINDRLIPDPPTLDSFESNSDEENKERTIAKPKIVKPPVDAVEDLEEEATQNEEQVKAIRGRRKPLYSKSNINNKVSPKTIKPAKTMTSNLMTNVSSALKSGASLKQSGARQIKPPAPRTQVKSSGYGVVRSTAAATPSKSAVSSRASSQNSSPKHSAKSTPPLERQGTFTKDDAVGQPSPKPVSRVPAPPSKIPSFASKIARAVTNKIPVGNNNINNRLGVRNGVVKSASTDRANRNNPKAYNRSTSADSREPIKKIQPSSSTQSLKNEPKSGGGIARKTGIPSPAQRSASNVSVTSNGSAKKQVTSKIASLWKKVEESKAKQPVQDKRKWIEQEKQPEMPRLIRSNTFENKEGVLLRDKQSTTVDPTTKRVSRLGSFIVMDEDGDGGTPPPLPPVPTVNVG